MPTVTRCPRLRQIIGRMASLTISASPLRSVAATTGLAVKLPSKTLPQVVPNAKPSSELKRLYSVGGVIGSGTSGEVRIAKEKASGQVRAIKIVDKRCLEDQRRLELECTIQASLDHPAVVKVYEVYESENEIFIVMEHMRGGELYDVMVDKEKFSEEEVRVATYQVLEAVNYLHEKGVIHRDIKPENILLTVPFDEQDLTKVQAKLSDFGSSRYLFNEPRPSQTPQTEKAKPGQTTADLALQKSRSRSSTSPTESTSRSPTTPLPNETAEATAMHVHQKPRMGKRTEQLRQEEGSLRIRRRAYSAVFTDYFIAPEVLAERGYDNAVDMWSMGVVLYILLCGFPPFFEDDSGQLETGTSLKDRIRRGSFDFPSPYWDEVSEDAKHLVRRMLTVDPRRRILAKDALMHPFFNPRTPSMDELQLTFNRIKLAKKTSISDGNESPGSEKKRVRSETPSS